jgi:transcription elongation factor Elf1
MDINIDAVHEGKKRFKCGFCNKEFSKNVDQKMHISTVHKEEKAVLVQSLRMKL